MKVIHLNIDWGGGLSALYQLHRGLRKAGVDSKIISKIKTLGSPASAWAPSFRIPESLITRITNRVGLGDLRCILNSFRFKNYQDYVSADIVNFHVVYGGFISYLALPALTRVKISVLTLHDMWNLTGFCGYSYDCQRWKTGCGKCPRVSLYGHNTRFEWKLKNWVYVRSKFTIVTPSHWLAMQVKESMLRNFPIRHIPHGIDTEVYRPIDKNQCRSMLGIPAGKRLIMFGASELHDPRKGFHILVDALRNLPESLRRELVLLCIGFGGHAITDMPEMQILDLGYIRNTNFKSSVYSAADLFVLPTQADNFPMSLLESMSCGTPIVSSNIGGIPELVRPGITGYLARPQDSKEFARFIVELLEDEGQRNFMSKQCRETATKEFSLDLAAERYLNLYRTLLKNG